MFLWALILIQSLFLCKALEGKKEEDGFVLFVFALSCIISSIPNITGGLWLEYINENREEHLWFGFSIEKFMKVHCVTGTICLFNLKPNLLLQNLNEKKQNITRKTFRFDVSLWFKTSPGFNFTFKKKKTLFHINQNINKASVAFTEFQHWDSITECSF